MEVVCQCGNVKIPIPFDKPLVVGFCHCNRCRLVCGSAFNVNAMFPYFPIPQQALDTLLNSWSHTSSGLGNTYTGYHCKSCGSRILNSDGNKYTPEQVEQGKGRQWLSIPAGRVKGLDLKRVLNGEDVGFPTMHAWTKEAVVPPKFWEGMASYEENVQEVKDMAQMLAEMKK